ncbi:MAG: TAXI family TRAP transporter solute-binding subunit [Hyphomicrobium sp.]|nr:TAXI family TRAP transporter solute-binding subunit [Hyphomicrobium sp.]MBN9265977.1 TAXI family TRAP transporter solute-binding subunit [Hyphomicrobium sp.]MBN9279665.1 TAXI family TRAP transporter solute-binding subunit [Hyphomicrobium sp.]
MKRLLALTAGIAVALTAAAAIAQTKQLSITTGGTGGVYYPLGGGFASIIGKNIPNTTAAAEVTGGSVANLQLIGSGRADIAFTQVDAAWDAVSGLDKFKSGKLPVQSLVVMYPNHMHVVTIDGTGVTKIEDLKGKRVSTGSPGSATEVFAFRVIEAAGLDKDKDMKRERLGVAESVNAIKDKKIDAFFWVGGLPTAAVTDLGATPGTKLRMIDIAQNVGKMVAKYGEIYAATVIPKGTYGGQDADNHNVAVWNVMAVNANMPEDLAYQLTKLMLEKREDLGTVHKEGLNIKAENQTKKKSGIPFHPGALKYFAEKGIKVD